MHISHLLNSQIEKRLRTVCRLKHPSFQTGTVSSSQLLVTIPGTCDANSTVFEGLKAQKVLDRGPELLDHKQTRTPSSRTRSANSKC